MRQIKATELKFKNEYYLFLLPAFFIIHRLSEHYEAIPLADAILLFVKYVLVIIAVTAINYFFIGSIRKAALFTTVLMALYFFYGNMHDELKKLFNNAFFTKYVFILPLAALFIVVLFIFFKRSKRKFNRLTLYLNLLLLVLVLFDGTRYILAKTAKFKSDLALKECPTCPKPDIYLIIADGYAGKLQLEEVYHFDNSKFYNDLKTRGFFVVESSLSNYKFTSNSITSMLNMDYFKNYKEDKSHELINKNEVIHYLKYNDYEIKNFSLFKIDDQYPFSKTQYFPIGTQLITDHTFLGRLQKDLGYLLTTKLKLKLAQEKLKSIEEKQLKENKERELRIIKALLKETGKKQTVPKFVYAHLIMPHGPYNYDKNGKPLDQKLPEKIKFIEYLQYTNGQILSLVDGILRLSAEPPIILFMSDHGHRPEEEVMPEKYYYSNINAIYFPNKKYNGYYTGMSNVNQFRVVLNTYFNQNLPMLKDLMAK